MCLLRLTFCRDLRFRVWYAPAFQITLMFGRGITKAVQLLLKPIFYSYSQ
jgi:hypothetical protein